MQNYDLLTDAELHEMFLNNARAMATIAYDAFGDEPMPDPRTMFRALTELPFDSWTGMMRDPDARALLTKNMDIMKVLGQIQLENTAIITAMLARN